MAIEKENLTPLMRQYWDVKTLHPDKILLFRMGDFFELFYEDAETAAPLLGIALTSRNKKSGDETPMCGVPHHSIANHINKLLSLGHKVAICDQLEEASQAKGIVKRGVTRILSPGMVFDPDTLDAEQFNYLMSFDPEHVAFLESSTGECIYFQIDGKTNLKNLWELLSPVEVVLTATQNEKLSELKPTSWQGVVSVHDSAETDPKLPACCSRLLAYAIHMQGSDILNTLRPFELKNYKGRLELSQEVIKHLELIKSYKGDRLGSLFHTINKCKTSVGARKLKNYLLFPLQDKTEIERRLDLINYWTESRELKELRIHLAHVGDLERRLGKISNPTCHPRDLVSLGESLNATLSALKLSPDQNKYNSESVAAQKMVDRISQFFVDELPAQYRSGGFIKKGVDSDLDETIDLAEKGQDKVNELEQRERDFTKIPSLKIRFNNVFGYYIEITNTHKDKVPKDRYQRKQTLANAERYVTDELIELEKKVLSAKSKRVDLELELYEQLKHNILSVMTLLNRLCQFVAEVDVSSSQAWLAISSNYVRPSWSQNKEILITGSRHPVVEQNLKANFIANDIVVNKGEVILLTGPNMAGKSTLMRQVALICILAQAGLYVPAHAAHLPILDKVYTRIGASDFLTEGLSTFMVEMKETALMLEGATENSLLILDEVGRGTSTYDGLSLAQSILEFLLSKTGVKVFFATHYHELTKLDKNYPNLKNAHMQIKETNGKLDFLYHMVSGSAERSYGIQVAKLAGLPKPVTARAEKLLKQLESNSGRETQLNAQLNIDQLDLFNIPPVVETLSEPINSPILEKIKQIDILKMTPLEALNTISEWQREIQSI